MSGLIDHFLSDLDDQVIALRAALDANDRIAVGRLAEAITVSAGGCGLPTIGDAAAEVGAAALSDEADLNELREKIETLITLCRRAGQPAGDQP